MKGERNGKEPNRYRSQVSYYEETVSRLFMTMCSQDCAHVTLAMGVISSTLESFWRNTYMSTMSVMDKHFGEFAEEHVL